MAIPGMMSTEVPQSRPAGYGAYEAAPVLGVRANVPFWMVHWAGSRGSWSVDTEGLDGPTWLPVVSPVSLQPGAFGVRTITPDEARSNPGAALTVARENVAKRNGVILNHAVQIPDDALPDGVPAGGYHRSVDAIGGQFYHTPWDQPRKSMSGAAPSPKHDAASYNRWRLWLVTSGQIAAPDEQVIDDAIAMLEQRLNTTVTNTATVSDREAKTRVQRAELRLEQARTARKPWTDAIPATTGGKRRRAAVDE